MRGARAVVATLALCSTVGAVPTAGAQQPPIADAEAGRRLYTSSCARCHGINLVSSGLGFDLRKFPPHDKPRFVASVSKGLRAMPAWEGILLPEQIDQLWAYIGSVNGWDAAEGAAPEARP